VSLACQGVGQHNPHGVFAAVRQAWWAWRMCVCHLSRIQQAGLRRGDSSPAVWVAVIRGRSRLQECCRRRVPKCRRHQVSTVDAAAKQGIGAQSMYVLYILGYGGVEVNATQLCSTAFASRSRANKHPGHIHGALFWPGCRMRRSLVCECSRLFLFADGLLIQRDPTRASAWQSGPGWSSRGWTTQHTQGGDVAQPSELMSSRRRGKVKSRVTFPNNESRRERSR
jgi:hypothetical protein